MSQKSFSVIRKHANRVVSGRDCQEKNRAGRVHRQMALRATDERFFSEAGRAPLSHAEVFEFVAQGAGTEWRRDHVVGSIQRWKRIEVLPALSLDALPALEKGVQELHRRAQEWAERYDADFVPPALNEGEELHIVSFGDIESNEEVMPMAKPARWASLAI